jgi:DNA-binding NarL/FixJ family response regulator
MKSIVGELRTVAVCDTQPMTADGIRAQLVGNADLQFQQAMDSLAQAGSLMRSSPPSVLLLDKAFGALTIINWLADLRAGSLTDPCATTGIVVWGVAVKESEALHFLRAGVRGILLKTAGFPKLVACLRTVAEGGKWIEDYGPIRGETYRAADLTFRERQILEMAESGLRNKDIALELGIRTGTVKTHLAHVYQKTGAHGRHAAALQRLRIV